MRCSPSGIVDPANIERSIKRNTKFIAVQHASNVNCSIQPIAEIGRIIREHNLTMLVDAAQTGGSLPIADMAINSLRESEFRLCLIPFINIMCRV
jgi:cysteine sulfinate desulfinase/cysteine desulfurase-like protein